MENGAKELILVAQETTVYGIDLYGEKMLPELLRKLCTIEGLVWIRLLYCYPEEITEELIQVMKEQPKVCHYLDMPIQHASDKILAKMGRKTRKEELEGIIAKLREEIPDICLRTTLISGFPGETEKTMKSCWILSIGWNSTALVFSHILRKKIRPPQRCRIRWRNP